MGLKTRLLLGALSALVFAFVGGRAEHILGAVAPTASPQSLTTPQDTPLLITLTSTDPDSVAQTFSIVTPPTRGSLGPLGVPVCVPFGGTTSGGPAGPAGSGPGGGPSSGGSGSGPAGSAGSNCTSTVTYTPAPGLSGLDSFTFKSRDGALDSNIATISITVVAVAGPIGPSGGPSGPGGPGSGPTSLCPGGPSGGPSAPGGCANIAPVALPQNLTTGQNAAKGISLVATDANSPALTFSIVTPPAHGTLGPLQPPNCLPAGLGSSCSAALFYTPTTGYTGNDVFTFKANDGLLDSNIATVSIVVTANAAPQAFGGGVFAAPGTPKQISLLGTDTDSASLTFTLTTPPTKGTVVFGAPVCTPSGSGTSCTVNATYTAGMTQTGADSFVFKVSDGVSDSNFATMNITITTTPPANVAPTAQNLNLTVSRNSSQTVQLAASDPDSAALSFAIVTPPLHGTLALVSPAGLNCTPNGGGVVCTQTAVYTPNPGYTGPDSFTYKANDGVNDSNIATGSANVVVPPNNPPTATSQTQTVGFNQPKLITLAGSDTDSAALTFAIVANPAKGTLGALGAPSCLPAGAGTNCTATVTYTPNAGQTGADSFTFKVNDGTSDSTLGTVTLNISNAPIGAAPTAAPQTVGVALNTPKLITLAAADTDSATLTMSIVSPPSHGTLSPLSAPVCLPAGGGSNCTATTTYTPTAGYNGPDSFSFKANDGTSDSNTATVTINVAPDIAPVVTTSAGNTTFTEGGAAVAIDPALTVTDADNANLASATVTITNILNPGLETLAANTGGTPITQAYNAGTGVLTLTGPATVAQFQQVMRTVTYRNTASPINLTTRVVRFVANDGVLPSNNGDKNVAITPLNAPVVTPSAGNTAFTEGGGAVVVDPAITVTDIDSPNLASAQVVIQTGCLPGEDVLGVTAPLGITPVYTPATCTLALTGSQPVALYQNTLRTVTYNNTSQNPNVTTRVLRFTANDGTLNSNNGDKNVTITAVNQAPVLTTTGGTTAFTEPGPAVAIDNGLTLTDVDSPNMASATVQVTTNCQSGQDVLGFTNQNGITGNYVAVPNCLLTLTGSSTVANYQAALRSVTYNNTSQNPNTTNRVVRFQANDGAALNDLSNLSPQNVSVASVNNPPSITLGLVVPNWTEAGPPVVVDAGLTVTDPDNANLASGSVTITNVQDVSELLDATNCAGLGLSGNGTATLTLANSGTLAAYQACLQSVTYDNGSLAPNTTPRNIRFVVNDGTTPSANADKALTVNGVNTAPAVTTSAGTTAFTEPGPAVVIDSGVTVADVDSANLASATVQITTNCQSGEDVLGFTNQNGISGVYTAAPNCILALTGSSTVANYQTALASVTYNNTSQNPNTTSRVVSFTVNDGVAPSNTATKTVSVTAVNNAPVLTVPAGTLAYTEGDPATGISGPGVTITDADSTTMATGSVVITGNCAPGEDVLSLAASPGVTAGAYVPGTCTLPLSGVATLAQWQTALENVQYSNTSNAPSVLPRTVTYKVNDGTSDSNLQTHGITVASVNSAPVVTTSAGTTTWNSFGGPQVIDSTITVTDADSPNLASATITIMNPSVDGALEVLGPTAPTASCPAGFSFLAGLNTLTISGTMTVAQYQTCLRTVTFDDTAASPTTGNRTIRFVVNDGTDSSNNGDKLINVVVPAPIAQDDPAYTATGNIQISIPAPGVLGNDTLNGGAIVSYGATTGNEQTIIGSPTPTAGIAGVQGSVTLNLDGSFTYDPPVGASSGTDTFVYKLQNSNPTTDTATVSITIGGGANQIVWFVSGSSVCVTNCGTWNNPFATTGALQTAQGTANGPAAGEALFIYENGSPYTGTNLTLLATQKLIGQDASGTFDAAIGFTPNAASTGPLPPLIPGGTPVLLQSAAGNTLTLGASNTVRGLTLGTSPGTSLIGTTFGTLTINDVIINNGSTGQALSLTTGTLASGATINSLSAGPTSGNGVLLSGVSNVSGVLSVGGGTLAVNSSGAAFSVVGGTVSVTYVGNISQAGAGALVSVSGGHTTGTLTFQTGTLSATGGTGLQFDNADSTTSYNFNGTTTLSGGDAGIDILNGSAGTFNFGGTTITNPTGVALNVDTSSGAVSISGAISKTSAGKLIDFNNYDTGTATISGNLTCNTSCTGVEVTNDGASSGTVNFSGGTKTLSTGANVAVNLDNNDGGAVNFTNGGLDIDTTTATGLNVVNGGTVTVQGASGNTIDTTTGTAVILTASTIGAAGMTFNSVSAGTGPGDPANGILLTPLVSSTGNFTANGGSIAGASTRGVDIIDMRGDFLYAGTITTTTTGRSVEVTNSGGGGKTIQFTGAVTDTGLGVNLSNNDNTGGTTVRFRGGLSVTPTGGNSAFVATLGGTVEVCNTNDCAAGAAVVNTLTTTTGTALTVDATTIGANGLKFRSITSNGAGSANGIILDTTGSNAGLTVTGNGGSCTSSATCTGGTIANKTGADGSTTQGSGIYLNSTINVSLTNMFLSDFQNFAIKGSSVTGFIFDNSVISGTNGNAAGAADEAAISFTNLLGSASISNDNISNGFEYILKVLNSSGTLNRLTVDNTTFGTNNTALGGDAFQIVASNTATANVTVTDSTFTNAREDLFNASVTQSANMDLVFRTNSLSNNHTNKVSAASNMLLFSTSTGTVTYDFSHNTSTTGATGSALAVAKGVPDAGSGGTMTGTVNANTIGVTGVVGSGSAFTGIFASALGSGTHTTAITNNIVRRYNEEGIFLKANDNLTGGNSVLNATVTGNQTLEPDSLAFAGLWVLAGSGSGTETNTVNVVVGNFATAGLQNDFTAGDPADGSDVFLQESGSASTINLTRAGSGSGTAVLVIQDDNVGTPSVVSVGDGVNLVNTFPPTPPPVAP